MKAKIYAAVFGVITVLKLFIPIEYHDNHYKQLIKTLGTSLTDNTAENELKAAFREAVYSADIISAMRMN